MVTSSWRPADTGSEQPVGFEPDADDTQPSSPYTSVAQSLAVVEAVAEGEDVMHLTPDPAQTGSQQTIALEPVAGESQPGCCF
jgi:hypothetical protein